MGEAAPTTTPIRPKGLRYGVFEERWILAGRHMDDNVPDTQGKGCRGRSGIFGWGGEVAAMEVEVEVDLCCLSARPKIVSEALRPPVQSKVRMHSIKDILYYIVKKIIKNN